MANTDTIAQRAEDVRDLRGQIAELQNDSGVIIKDTSPPRRMAAIYSMVDGEELSIPVSFLERTLEKRLPGGGYMFTARQELAPTYVVGEVKCFLNGKSPERPILDDLGIPGDCPKVNLRNLHAKRMHAEHRHSQEWRAYREYVQEAKELAQAEQAQKQLDATLALAGKAAS